MYQKEKTDKNSQHVIENEDYYDEQLSWRYLNIL